MTSQTGFVNSSSDAQKLCLEPLRFIDAPTRIKLQNDDDLGTWSRANLFNFTSATKWIMGKFNLSPVRLIFQLPWLRQGVRRESKHQNSEQFPLKLHCQNSYTGQHCCAWERGAWWDAGGLWGGQRCEISQRSRGRTGSLRGNDPERKISAAAKRPSTGTFSRD